MARKRKKGNNRRPRQQQIIATVTALTDDLSLVYDSRNNRIEFPDSRVDFIQQQVLYQRGSGKDKVLSVVPGATDDGGYLETLDQLRNSVDFLFAVDTNTKAIRGRRVSFCVSYWVPRALRLCGLTFPFCAYTVFEINDVILGINPECAGWCLVIREIAKSPLWNMGCRIGVVVDSELGAIRQMNLREVPFFGNELLPENVTLIYASADAGGNALPNRMISYCDRLATRIASSFEERGTPLNTRQNGGSAFFGYRHITLRNPEKGTP